MNTCNLSNKQWPTLVVLGLDFLKSISFLVGYDLETSSLAWSLHDVMHGSPPHSL